MMTQEIINEIGEINISNSEDFENLDRIQELTDLLRINGDGYLACESLINLMERHPQIEFGTPGEPIPDRSCPYGEGHQGADVGLPGDDHRHAPRPDQLQARNGCYSGVLRFIAA